MKAPEWDLVLTRPWCRPGRDLHLAVDLPAGVRVRELTDLARSPGAVPGTILIGGPHTECRALPDGGLLVGEGVFWSLLDPLAAGGPVSPHLAERLETEIALREQAARFRRRLEWWRSLDTGLKNACRRFLRRGDPDLTPLLDAFDQLPLPQSTAAAETVPAVDALPLPSTGTACPVAAEDLFAWFSDPDGLGAVIGSGFTPRPEQAEMARTVAHALAHRDALLVEAGTGVGKTLAYLAPLVAAVINDDVRAVVSTHTRALQAQVMNLDLPRLQPLLGGKRFRLLMGRRNYLCLRQRQAFESKPVEAADDALRAAAFRLWLNETADGMRDEVASHPLLGPVARELFDAPDMCLPGLCYEGGRCFVQQARRQARDADILVVNHSLLLHDRRASATLLGEYEILVVDEAHRLPAVTLETHSVACGLWRLADLENLLGAPGSGSRLPERLALAASRLRTREREGERAAAAAEDLGGAVRRVFSGFRAWWQSVGKQVDQALPVGARDTNRQRVRDKDEFFGPLRSQTAELLDTLAAADGTFAAFASLVGLVEDLGGGLEDDLAQIAHAGQVLRQLHHDVEFLVTADDEDWVTWIEPGRRSGIARLGATLLEAGSVLREYWRDADLRPIMTSATLAVGEDFSHMLDELGMSRRRPATLTWTSPSPFDHHRQTLILTPARFPAPGSPTFGAAVGEVMAQLAAGPQRKTLGLFTSYRAIREAEAVLAAAGYGGEASATTPGSPTVLAQTPGTATGALLERFRAHKHAVLLGTATFWEGVDFPGEDLEVLVVAKLPFLVPSDPWVEARCERLSAMGENPFTRFMVRDAVLRLRQGFGRLIRRHDDRGVVVILDNRLHTKNYGSTFLSALPIIPATFGDEADLMNRIEAFFRGA